jgi:hypothetical protein
MSSRPLPYTVHSADQTTTDQRLDEVAGLLAAGILRLRLRNEASAGAPQKIKKNGLASCARQSVHASRTRV